MTKRLGVGLIGLGAISEAHLKTIQENEELELVGVADRNNHKAERIAEVTHCKAYNNNKELIKDNDVDLVVLLTPPGYHEELITDCAMNGKHIIAEKPVGTDTEKIKKYLRLCKEKEIKLSIVSQHRFDSSAIITKKKLEQGALGKL